MDLLERGPELTTLRRLPPGQVALVRGEAGIGKSALVRAVADDLRAGGGRVLWGSGDPLAAPRPLGPLHDLARGAGGALAATMAAESDRSAMFEAFLDELGAHEDWAVVEDAHWVDQPTLDLLLFAARRLGSTRSRMIVTYRDDELSSHDPLRALVGQLATASNVTRIALSPLSIDAVAILAEPIGVPARALHERTGGNPFFVSEALADPSHPVPATAREAVLGRAAALGPAERAALEAVAIFPGGAVASLVQADPADLDRCVAAGMLVGEGPRVRFRHELARLAILESLAPGRRAVLNARALADLTRRGTDPAWLAHHAQEAGDAGAVLVQAQAAAARAHAVGAHHQVYEHYDQAVRFSAGLGDQERAELLERYAEAASVTGQDETAVSATLQALAVWRVAGDLQRQSLLLGRLSTYRWNLGDGAGALTETGEALRLARSGAEGPALAEAWTNLAVHRMLAREIGPAIEAGLRAIELAERLNLPRTLARALNAVGSSYWFTDPDQAEAPLRRSIEVARRVGHDQGVAVALSNLGSGAGEVRRYAEAERWLRESMEWSTQRELDGIHGYSAAWLGRCLMERGAWAEAGAVLAQCADTGRSPTQIVMLSTRGRLRLRQGLPGADVDLDAAWALAAKTGDVQRLWPVAAGRAEMAWLAGQPTGHLVREVYQQAVDLQLGWAIGELGQWLEPAPSHHATAAAAAPYRLAPDESARAWDDVGAPYDAALALALGPADDGQVDRLRDALARFERLGARPAAERVARMLRDRGVRPARRTTLSHPSGLTAREVDVLELLREGLRNSEIGQRLHISEKTVDHHVSSILAKLDVPSRREAARHVG